MTFKRISMKEQAYTAVKEKILNKEYKLGDYINIDELTREFKVSNTPIREALSAIMSEGLIELAPNNKYRVISLSEKDIIDLNETLKILLLGALKIIIRDDKVESIENMLEESYKKHLEIYENRDAFDYKFIKTSIDFDRQFILATENKYLIREFDNLVDVFILASIYNRREYKDIHLEEHRQILMSIKNKDYDETQKVLIKHFRKKRKDMDY